MKKTAIILFNLGGPDSIAAVKPFLFNLFNDAAIVRMPQPFRYLLAKVISITRRRKAEGIYKAMGGKSTILPETLRQGEALENALNLQNDAVYKTFVVMRYWHPFASEQIKAVKAFTPDKIILLPLYPHFSTTTTLSSIQNWKLSAKGWQINTKTIESYGNADFFVKSYARALRKTLDEHAGMQYKVLFSAHSLPQRIIDQGDPYQKEIESSAKAIAVEAGVEEYILCYQSKVGRLKWLEPSTETIVLQTAKAGLGIIIVPISFVSEHSETVVELDIEYKTLALASGALFYARIATVRTNPIFIQGLAKLCHEA